MSETKTLLVRLPESLVDRFKRRVSARERSQFIQRLLENALPEEAQVDNDPLYQAALAAEEDDALTSEMSEWESATIGDGFAKHNQQDSTR